MFHQHVVDGTDGDSAVRRRVLRPIAALLLRISLAAVFACLLPAAVYPQGVPSAGGGGNEGRIEGRFSFVPVPYLNYSRTLGLSVGALPMAMFNPLVDDTLSPSSMAGLLGMYTTNNTWFLMGFVRLYFNQGNWRATAAGGSGSVNFQFYAENPVGGFVPYNTNADFLFFMLQRRILTHLFAGVSYSYTGYVTRTEALPSEHLARHHGAGLQFSWDDRSNVYYPRDGTHLNTKFVGFPEWLGNELKSNRIEIDMNRYFPMPGDRDVLAARLYGGFGLGDLSFNQQFIVGRRDVRGYSQGKYRGNSMIAAQAEYRWNPLPRWGAVAFIGVASVFRAQNEQHDGKLLPGAGGGVRFTAFPDNNMNVGLDAAVGIDDWGIYFRVGESF